MDSAARISNGVGQELGASGPVRGNGIVRIADSVVGDDPRTSKVKYSYRGWIALDVLDCVIVQVEPITSTGGINPAQVDIAHGSVVDFKIVINMPLDSCALSKNVP